MLEELKEKVWEANQKLKQHSLATLTWGNASGIDRESGLFVIKPSGVDYQCMSPRDLVVIELCSGRVVEGLRQPSVDTNTHLALYRAFPQIGGITHTHSRWATAWAQAGRSIPVYGTTHADYFCGEIPCTRSMTPAEISGAYEEETGNLIVETFQHRSPMQIPAVLVRSHGPFTWGADPYTAVVHAIALEELAFMAFHTELISPEAKPISQALLDKHSLRKNGKTAYYGQYELPCR